MSAIKNHFHEQIVESQREALLEIQMEEEFAENQRIEQEAEKDEFFKIFELTGTFPI